MVKLVSFFSNYIQIKVLGLTGKKVPEIYVCISIRKIVLIYVSNYTTNISKLQNVSHMKKKCDSNNIHISKNHIKM